MKSLRFLRLRPVLLACLVVLPVWLTPATTSAQLPTLGDGSDMAIGAERRLGDRIAKEIYRDPDFIDDPVLVEYVEGIWRPLREAARLRGELTPELEERFAWEVMLGRDRTVNAFALPGGYMGVHLGLIAVVSNRDELASVLAHETSHITQRHISRAMSRQNQTAPWLMGAMILGMLAASKSPDAANALIVGGQAAAAQSSLNFSRDMEREADRVGYAVLSQAGFEPQGFVSMFEKLQQASRLNDNGAFPYLRTHPLTTERIADMQARLPLQAVAAPPPPMTMEHALLTARARIIANAGADSLRAAVAQARDSTLSAQPQVRQAAVMYAAAWAAMRLRERTVADELAGRLQSLTRQDEPGARLARLLKAEVMLELGDGRDAAALLQGLSPRRPELLLAAQGLIQSGRAALALPALQARVAQYPRDASAWQWLSSAYAAAGQPLVAIRADAEAHAARLDWAAALDRFKAAQALVRRPDRQPGPNDYLEISIVDTRARQVESALREQSLER